MKRTPQLLIAILNRLKVKPELKSVAAEFKLTRAVLYQWAAASAKGDPDFIITWLEESAPWHLHLKRARRVSISVMDEVARELCISGSIKPRFTQGGHPVWKVSPQKASLASDPTLTTEQLQDLQRMEDGFPDIFEHDHATGDLIQETESTPPNPQLLIKALTANHPEWSERVEHSHTLQVGGVLTLSAPPAAAVRVVDADFTTLAESPESVLPPTNVLAIAAPCASVEEFEQMFGGKRLTEGTLTYDETGTLLPPRPEIIIVDGSSMDLEYTAAHVPHAVTTPESLIAQGYCNPFLLKLAPERELPRDDKGHTEDDDIADDAPVQRPTPRPVQRPTRPSNIGDGTMGYGSGKPLPGGYPIC